MIVYGTKGSHIKSERVSGVQCNNCESQQTHTVSIFGKYFYIYWIPLFSIGKKGVSECNNCKATYDRDQMSEPLKRAHDKVKSDTKTPFTHFIGLIIIAALIGFGVFTAGQHKKDMITFIESPEVNDIIDYKSSDNAYSTLKITKVTADSISIVANTMEIAKKSKLYKIDESENYNAERYSLSRADYKEAFKTERFLDVDR